MPAKKRSVPNVTAQQRREGVLKPLENRPPGPFDGPIFNLISLCAKLAVLYYVVGFILRWCDDNLENDGSFKGWSLGSASQSSDSKTWLDVYLFPEKVASKRVFWLLSTFLWCKYCPSCKSSKLKLNLIEARLPRSCRVRISLSDLFDFDFGGQVGGGAPRPGGGGGRKISEDFWKK